MCACIPDDDYIDFYRFRRGSYSVRHWDNYRHEDGTQFTSIYVPEFTVQVFLKMSARHNMDYEDAGVSE